LSWSEERFKNLLVARAKELGKPMRTLLAEAGLDHSTIDKPPKTGSRRLDTLTRIAEAFGLDLAEVVGLPPSPVQPDVLLMAEEMTRRILSYRTLIVGDLQRVSLQARIYDVLAGRRAQGQWPLEAREITLMEELLRREVRGR
jgi:hypothetical protein